LRRSRERKPQDPIEEGERSGSSLYSINYEEERGRKKIVPKAVSFTPLGGKIPAKLLLKEGKRGRRDKPIVNCTLMAKGRKNLRQFDAKEREKRKRSLSCVGGNWTFRQRQR